LGPRECPGRGGCQTKEGFYFFLNLKIKTCTIKEGIPSLLSTEGLGLEGGPRGLQAASQPGEKLPGQPQLWLPWCESLIFFF
jgi:hypothetical protein